MNNIAFIGGIHGVGKSSICEEISRELNMEYLSASELLKWDEINKDVKNKKVQNIHDTQNRLILGLTNTIEKGKYYLLDGHYCLLSNNGGIIKVPLEIFKKINPFSLNIILGNIKEIKKRLETRDNKEYDLELLEHLQDEELTYAKSLSEILGKKLNIGSIEDYSDVLSSLRFFVRS